MTGCPLLKAALVRVPRSRFIISRGCRRAMPSNGFRMFSRRVIDTIAVESDRGFCYSIELLVKCHRLGWRDRRGAGAAGLSASTARAAFKVLSWLPAYLRWYGYAFATTFLRRPPSTVAMKAA